MWAAVGDVNNKDFIQIGGNGHHPGKSHVIEGGGYPNWGDSTDINRNDLDKYALAIGGFREQGTCMCDT